MEQVLSSIQCALENEMRERDFYLHHSRRTANAVGRRMFETIAAEEDEHYARLLQLHDHLRAAGTWPETIPAAVGGTRIRAILDHLPELAHESPAADADDIAAVRTAIDFEQNAYRFYTQLQESAGTAAVAGFFQLLASIELEHYRSLKDTLQYFEDPSSWYTEREKPHFEA